MATQIGELTIQEGDVIRFTMNPFVALAPFEECIQQVEPGLWARIQHRTSEARRLCPECGPEDRAAA